MVPPWCSRGVVLLVLTVAAVFVSAQPQPPSGASNRAYLQCLLERPAEPIFYGARGRENVVFRVPQSYVPPRFQKIATDIGNRFGAATVPVNISQVNVPDISLPMQLGRREPFSLFIPYHRRMATRLVEVLMGMRTYEDFLSASVFCRERVNPYLFSYAMTVATIHRKDTQGAQLPGLPNIFPEKFFDRAVFPEVRREANLVDDSRERLPIEIPMDWTATDLEPEHRVAYFREDVGINVNHWSWHLVYPFDGPREIVMKDRRGEINYYFHQQVIARYNFERFSNRLPRVRRLLNLRERIDEAYFPKLDTLLASRVYAGRPAGLLLSDINRQDMQITFDIATLERWRDRILEAIHSGSVQSPNGTRVPLDERFGTDILGSLVESSPLLSVNQNLYGDLHNLGHVLLGLAHDPDHRHLESFSVAADPTTTMRDPVFYRWHSFIDDVFHQHKQTLPPYTVQQLGFDGIQIAGVTVESQGVNRPNEFSTFWQQSDLDLSQGLDFVPRGPVLVRVTHLQHAPFRYRIQVRNTGAQRIGTVRIFLAPQVDERGTSLTFREQRLFFIELDKFQFNFQPGENTVVRLSENSSVTVPFEYTFRNLSSDLGQSEPLRDELNYCGCGWPHHMLLPKGHAEGMQAHLFVMVSNFADDRVGSSPLQETRCNRGHSYCGVFNQPYPDRRPMGYPFDRLPRQGVTTLAQFLTPNMNILPVTIRFNARTERPNSPSLQVGPATGNNGAQGQSRPQPGNNGSQGQSRPQPGNNGSSNSNRPPVPNRPPNNNRPPGPNRHNG